MTDEEAEAYLLNPPDPPEDGWRPLGDKPFFEALHDATERTPPESRMTMAQFNEIMDMLTDRVGDTLICVSRQNEYGPDTKAQDEIRAWCSRKLAELNESEAE